MARTSKKLFNHKEIEEQARAKWASLELYTCNLSDSEKEPYYLLVEFPYPSGDLHTGHWYAYAMPDIYARYLRMIGKNVLFPFGFDAFGLPAENAAIKRGLDPKKWTYENMHTMRSQMHRMGVSYDWSKEVITCDPEYYKWTQWLFSKLYEHQLAERRKAPVKWCPKDLTVLANEQVINGHCERCGSEVEEKLLTQWFLKITQYAKRLIADLEPLPWAKEIKDAQRAWIGESEGAKITFPLKDITLEDLDVSIEVFTTRPDTIYGVTYVVISPEHPLLDLLMPAALNALEIDAYKLATTKKTERERSENKEKTGVKLEGVYAYNPATLDVIPVYVADYVLASYGTGAVMAVPAHDERDFEFAKKYDLPIKNVVEPVFTKTLGTDAVKEDLDFVERDAVVCIVKHWKDDSYLLLKWKKVEWEGFVTGGIESGEDMVEAAKRELLEETGFTHAKFIKKLGSPVHAKFYHVHKKENRHARFHGLYFELEDRLQNPISEEEKAFCDMHWVSREEVEARITAPDMKLIWQRVFSPEEAYTGDGILANSGIFDGIQNTDAVDKIIETIGAEKVTQYRLRDWLVSRQRYWGCPIPIVYDPEGNPHIIPLEHLPWELPTDVDFTPTEKSPLATSKELHERVERIFGKGWTPEYDTLDTFVDSSWYYMRYLDSKDSENFSDQKQMKQWLPVNRYSGGSEHTTMHLLYARFFNKALYDLALTSHNEPFLERFNRGLILGPDGQKMSKSKGNVINPDELVEKYGSDAVRMYLAFIGPYNEAGNYPWNLDGVEAMRRFLDRIWKLFEKVSSEEITDAETKLLAKTAKKVGADIEKFKFNTALSALMVLVREIESLQTIAKKTYSELLVLLAPFAPHTTESLWDMLELEGSVHQSLWVTIENEQDEEFATVVVQINSKKRGQISVQREATEAEALTLAKEIPEVSKKLADSKIVRIVYVKGRILNIVTGN